MTFSVESKSQLAKLLATENLRVEHRKVQTAYFDLKNRTIVCPIWESMSGELYDLLLSHEVGHAQETTLEGWHDATCDRGANYKHFLNVVEDARIEKKIKRKYPGLRYSYVKGYQNLIDRDFFGTKNQDVNEMSFIDRLNIHCKSGSLSDVKFHNDEEVRLLTLVESTETWEDVLDATEQVWNYSKKEQKEINEKSFDQYYYQNDDDSDDDLFDDDDKDEQSDDVESDNSTSKLKQDDEDGETSDQEDKVGGVEGDSDQEEADENQKMNSDSIDEDENDDLEDFEPTCNTDVVFRKKETELLSRESLDYQYIDIPTPNLEKIVTPYKTVHEQLSNHFQNLAEPSKLVVEFKEKNERYINLLVKEFEMRKAATAYKKTKLSNTGDIDLNKIYKYQLDDNIFRKLTQVKKGKSHGLVLVLDSSGSMSVNMGGSIEQILVLASFCRKVNIPFVVYGFTSHLFDGSVDASQFSSESDEMVMRGIRVREYLSSKMKSNEFIKGFQNMTNLKMLHETNRTVPAFEYLAMTPLNETIVALTKITEKFKKENGVDIVNLVIVQDGDADNVNYMNDWQNGVQQYKQINGTNNLVLRDKKRKIEVLLPRGNSQKSLTSGLLDWYKKATDSKVFGFFITPGNYRQLRDQLYSKYDGDIDSTELVKHIRKEKFVISKRDGYEKFYLILGGDYLKIKDEGLVVEGKVTKGKLFNAFTKMNKQKQANRALVTNFIQGIAE